MTSQRRSSRNFCRGRACSTCAMTSSAINRRAASVERGGLTCQYLPEKLFAKRPAVVRLSPMFGKVRTLGSPSAKSGLEGKLPLQDKQSEPDHRQLRIDKVGVRGLRFPIQIRDKERALQNTIATIGMYVD